MTQYLWFKSSIELGPLDQVNAETWHMYFGLWVNAGLAVLVLGIGGNSHAAINYN